MKFFIIFVVAQAVIMQVSSQFIRTIGPQIIAPACGPQILAPACAPQIIAPQPIVTRVGPPSVAESLADTLSLLTVSSLLADTLPLGYNNVIGIPALPACGCGLPTCGCGLPTCGCGLPTCGCGIPTYGCGLPICGCGLPVCGCGYSNIYI